MANYHITENTTESLTAMDKSFLKALYDMRCLDISLAFRFFYSKEHPQRFYCDRRIEIMQNAGLIEPLEYGKDHPALFLTTLGIETLRYLDIITTENDSDDRRGRDFPTIRSSYSLKMKPNLIPHQMSLNYFVLDFKDSIGAEEMPIYYDAISVPKCSDSLLPDGLIIYHDRLSFLEMDMASERKVHLRGRCASYLRFINSPAPFYFDKKISVLFILENVSSGIKRRSSFINCMFESGIFLNYHKNVEFYVNTPEVLQPLLQSNYDPIPKGYLEEAALVRSALSKVYGFSGFETLSGNGIPTYDAVIQRSGSLSKACSGIPNAFLMDFWYDGRLSILTKIFYHQRICQHLCRQGRCSSPIPYLVAVPDEKEIFTLLKACDFFHIPNVFFLSASRLDGRAFSESVFSFADDGSCIHFADNALTVPIREQS